MTCVINRNGTNKLWGRMKHQVFYPSRLLIKMVLTFGSELPGSQSQKGNMLSREVIREWGGLAPHSLGHLPDPWVSVSRREYCQRVLRKPVLDCSTYTLAFDTAVFIIESTRRRVAVEAMLENRGENAYSTVLNISQSANLQFASLIQKVRVW